MVLPGASMGQDDQVFQLGGNTYVLASPMVIEDLDAWPEVVRTTGSKQRADRINANAIIWEDMRYGVGIFNTKGPLPEELVNKAADVDPSWNAFWSSTLSTEYIGQYTLPLLPIVTTHTNNSSPDHSYDLLIKYGQNLYAVSDTANESIGTYAVASPNFAQGKDLTSGYTNLLIQGSCETQAGLLLFGGSTTTLGTPWIRIHADGTYNNVTPHTGLNGKPPYSMKPFKGNIYAAIWDSANGQVEIWKSTDDGTTFTAISGMVITHPQLGIIDLVQYRDSSGQPTLLLHVNEGLFLLDLGAETITLITNFGQDHASSGASHNTLAREFGGNLYLPRNKKLIEYHWSGEWQDVSPLTSGRLDSAFIHPDSMISALDVGGPWLFVAISSATKNTVWKFDGLGYHFMWYSGTTTDAPGITSIAVFHNVSRTVDELHIIQNVGSTGPKVNFIRLDHVLTNPLENSAATFAASGTIQFPHTDAGMSDAPGSVLGYSISADATSLDTVANDNELVKISTEVDRAGSYANELTWGSDSDLRQKIIVSNDLGVTFASAFRSKMTLVRGSTTTKTPVVFAVETLYDKLVEDIHAYTVAVDLVKTAEHAGGRSDAQSTLVQLEAVKASKQRTRFSYAGSEVLAGTTTRYVRMRSLPSEWATDDISGAAFPRVDEGVTVIRLEEAMP